MINNMRIAIVLGLVLMASLVHAADITFIAGKSYTIDDKNITLVRFDRSIDKALFCVNGVKSIIDEDKTREVNGIFIRVKDVKLDRVIADIDYSCRGCVCDKNCDNSVCFKESQAIDEAFGDGTVDSAVNEVVDADGDGIVDFGADEEIIQPVDIGAQTKVIILLLIVIGVLGIIALWRMR